MPTTRLATSMGLPEITPRDEIELIKKAEGWGYSAAWASEAAGPEAFSMLGSLAAVTDMDLGVAVVPVQTRTPFTLSMAAMTVAALTRQSFALGLGASSEVIVSRFAGQRFDRPLQNVREVVEAIRPVLKNGRSTFHGEYVDIEAYKYPTPIGKEIPIYLGSLNRKSLQLCGKIADGLCLNQIAPHHVPRMLEQVKRGAESEGRRLPDPFPVVARIFCRIAENRDDAYSMIRRRFAPYIATSVYNRFYRWMGYSEEAESIARAAQAGNVDEMREGVSDEILEDLFVVGNSEHVVSRVRRYIDFGVTVPVIHPLVADYEEAERMYMTIGEAWART